VKTIVVATRKSALALAQTRAWIEKLRATGVDARELHVTTTGDRIQSVPLSEVGGKGLFIKEIEEALLDGSADIAVHSMKDVPGTVAPGLLIGCVPPREDPRDAVVTRDGRRLSELPPGSKVGTSSLRRRVMIAALCPELEVLPLRGNVDTRLRRCDEGVVDAVVLALAGLRRLGLAHRATEILEPDQSLPAIGQGALAVEQRAGEPDIAALLSKLSDVQTATTVAAERGVMVAAEGSCQTPIAGHATIEGSTLRLRAMLAEPDGSRPRWDEIRVAYPCSEQEAFDAGLVLGRRLKSA
jgi:hydroxymethylbilane synthase